LYCDPYERTFSEVEGGLMTTETSLEQRLTAVEQAVSELQQRVAHLPPTTNWLARITGSFKDEPAFEDVLALGRAIRAADRPHDEADTQA
jgi:hypothetical protein